MCRVTFNQKLYAVALRLFANTNMAKASGVGLYSNNFTIFSHRQENLGPLILSSSRGTRRIYLVHIELSEEGFYRWETQDNVSFRTSHNYFPKTAENFYSSNLNLYFGGNIFAKTDLM